MSDRRAARATHIVYVVFAPFTESLVPTTHVSVWEKKSAAESVARRVDGVVLTRHLHHYDEKDQDRRVGRRRGVQRGVRQQRVDEEMARRVEAWLARSLAERAQRREQYRDGGTADRPAPKKSQEAS